MDSGSVASKEDRRAALISLGSRNRSRPLISRYDTHTYRL